MLCGELLNGGFVSAGAVPAVPCGLLGLWIPGCVRATSPRLLTSPYLPLLAELLATGYFRHNNNNNINNTSDHCYNHFDNFEDMDLVRHNTQHSNTNGQSEQDFDLDNDDSSFL
ncbi:hypothetical protein PV325_010877, partial [Microctonus aethiopoides]